MDSADRIEAAYQSFRNRLEPGFAGCDPRFIFDAGYRAASTPPIEQSGLDGADLAWLAEKAAEIDSDWAADRQEGGNAPKPDNPPARILTALTADKARDEALEEAAKELAAYCKRQNEAGKISSFTDAYRVILSLKGAAK